MADILKRGNWSDAEKAAMTDNAARMVDDRAELFKAAQGQPCLVCGAQAQTLAQMEVERDSFGGCNQLFVPLCLSCLGRGVDFDKIAALARRLKSNETRKQ